LQSVYAVPIPLVVLDNAMIAGPHTNHVDLPNFDVVHVAGQYLLQFVIHANSVMSEKDLINA